MSPALDRPGVLVRIQFLGWREEAVRELLSRYFEIARTTARLRCQPLLDRAADLTRARPPVQA